MSDPSVQCLTLSVSPGPQRSSTLHGREEAVFPAHCCPLHILLPLNIENRGKTAPSVFCDLERNCASYCILVGFLRPSQIKSWWQVVRVCTSRMFPCFLCISVRALSEASTRILCQTLLNKIPALVLGISWGSLPISLPPLSPKCPGLGWPHSQRCFPWQLLSALCLFSHGIVMSGRLPSSLPECWSWTGQKETLPSQKWIWWASLIHLQLRWDWIVSEDIVCRKKQRRAAPLWTHIRIRKPYLLTKARACTK